MVIDLVLFCFVSFLDVVFCLDVELPFTPRIVTIKKNKSVTDEYQLMEILGRYEEENFCRFEMNSLIV